MTHICVSKLTYIGSDNGLSPGRRQAIIWTNAGILLIRTLGTNFSEILSEICAFSFKKMHLKMSSVKWRPFCLGLNVLNTYIVLVPMLWKSNWVFLKPNHAAFSCYIFINIPIIILILLLFFKSIYHCLLYDSFCIYLWLKSMCWLIVDVSLEYFKDTSTDTDACQSLQSNAYGQISNIRRTLLGNKIVDHSDVVGASPVGAAPTTSSFSTKHQASIDWAETTARRGENHLCFAIWCVLYERFTVFTWWGDYISMFSMRRCPA